MKQERKLRKSACLSFRAQLKCRWHTSSIYWVFKLRDKGTSGHGEEVQLFSFYFKARPRKDENISRIQRSRTVASHDASFVPWSSWAIPHHCVVIPILHSCRSITCVMTVTGEDKPWWERLSTRQSSVKDLTAQGMGFRSPDHPVV